MAGNDILLTDTTYDAKNRLILDNRSLLATNLVSTADWESDLSGSTANFIEYNFGALGTNSRERITGPYGTDYYAWKTYADNNGAGLGFNNTLTSGTNAFPIDNTKKYRMSLWLKRDVASTSTETLYFSPAATDGSTAVFMERYDTGANLTYSMYINVNSTLNTQIPEDVWRLLVAIVWPTGTTGSLTGDSGIWALDGTQVAQYNEMRWKSTATYGAIRIYSPYSATPGATGRIAYPRIEVMDGTEMSFQELLKGPSYKEVALKA